MNLEGFRRHAVAPFCRGTPTQIVAPAYGVPFCTLDDGAYNSKLVSDVYRHNFRELQQYLFSSMCPNYSSDPSAAIKELCQVYRDETGTEVEIPIQEYINAFKDAMRPVATRDPAPAPYAREFILRLNDNLRNLVKQSFKSHLKVTDTSRPVQMA